jgi:site-specific DNA recombinase
MNKQILQSEKILLDEILGGKYRNCYLIYDRKSTDEPNNQKNSLEYQKNENIRFSKRENLPIAQITLSGFVTNGIISEKHSAFKENDLMLISDDGTVQFNIERPKFHRMVQLLHKGLFKGVIFLCWDRASRNPSDSTIIKKLIKAGVDVRFALATYDKTSSGSLHQDIDGMFSEHHSRVTSEKVTLVTRENRRKGMCTYRAPVGYLNLGTMENKPFDPERAPFITKMFQLADEGWSLMDISKWATEQGFTMAPTRKRRSKEEILSDEEKDEPSKAEKLCLPPKYTTIQKILRNRFYTGMIMDENGIWIKSNSHEELVDIERFERVQENLTKKNKSKKYDMPLDHPFRKQFICNDCKRSYTPYPKKGNLYLGSRCRTDCTNVNKSFNVDFISENVAKIIQGMHFTDDELEIIDARASTDIALLENKRQDQIEQAERKKKKLREDLAYLRTNKITLLKTGAYSPEVIVSEETRLENEIKDLIVEEHTSEIAMQETMKDVFKLSELLKNLIPYWEYANPHQKEGILRIIFSELSIYENNLYYQVTLAFKPFETRLFSLCARERT